LFEIRLDSIVLFFRCRIDDPSSGKHFFFPAPLNQRVLAFQAALRNNAMAFDYNQGFPFDPMNRATGPGIVNHNSNWWNASMIPSSSSNPFPDGFNSFQNPANMWMPNSYNNSAYPVTQTGLNNYFQQAMNASAWPTNFNGPSVYPSAEQTYTAAIAREYLVQQQRLNYNHERLLERFNGLTQPYPTEFRPFGTSTLPGRNYDFHLRPIQRDYAYNNSLAAQSRARIYSSPVPFDSERSIPIYSRGRRRHEALDSFHEMRKFPNRSSSFSVKRGENMQICGNEDYIESRSSFSAARQPSKHDICSVIPTRKVSS
jgi:hypothetical protein